MTSRRHRLTRAVAPVLVAFVLLSAETHAQPATPASSGSGMDDLLQTYRTEPADTAVAGFNRLIAGRGGQEEVLEWIQTAARARRSGDLEAALLLCSESIARGWMASAFNPQRVLLVRLPPLERLHLALRQLDPQTRFLRVWYLFWESFRQANIHEPMPEAADFLDEALDAFPRDSQTLLAAGARHELLWRVSLNNAERDPRGEPARVKRYLVDARGWLQRSLSADPKESEARLRLARVALSLDDLGGAEKALTGYAWAPEGRAFEYLALLFEGELHERRGDTAAAATAYDRAISLIAVAQSAQIARAHLAHSLGSRTEAARLVLDALSRASDQSDPWWLYIRGQMWRSEYYFRVLRSLVRPTAPPDRQP